MACRVCLGCDLHVPDTVTLCPACGGEQKYEHALLPDIDWEYKAIRYVSPANRKLILWRRKTFVEFGFSGAILDLLVESKVDPHAAGDLISRGCSAELAVQILL